MDIEMTYYLDERGNLRVRINDHGWNDPASGFCEAAADFVETGEWGWLDPEKNEDLKSFRDLYLSAAKN